MVAIWKFPLEVTDVQTVVMPAGAVVLCVQMQRDWPCLWAKVPDPGAVFVDRRQFRIVGTGHHFADDEVGAYIGTYQRPIDGGLVFHVFEAAS